jgi:hypothetical protein
MPLCYSFSKSAKDKTALNEDGIKEAAAASLMARLSSPRTPTSSHLCATLDGEYNCLLKFEYSALSDVAKAILDNRRRFGAGLSQTLTMLQYPDNGRRAPVKPRGPCFEDPATPRGLLLLQERLLDGYGTSSEVIRQLEPVLGDVKCIDVFGPFDYIVEFDAASNELYLAKIAKAAPLIAQHVVRHEALF